MKALPGIAVGLVCLLLSACTPDRPAQGTPGPTHPDTLTEHRNPDGSLRALGSDTARTRRAPATVRLAQAGQAASQAPTFTGALAFSVTRQGADATRLQATVTHAGQPVQPRPIPLGTFSDPAFLTAFFASRGDTLLGTELYGYAPLSEGWELMILGLRGKFFAGAESPVLLAGLPIQRATGATRPPLLLAYSYQQMAADFHTATWLTQLAPGGAPELVLANRTLIERERGVTEEEKHQAFAWDGKQFKPTPQPPTAQLRAQFPLP